MIVYVASPYAGDIGNNIIRARAYCRHVVNEGHMPIAPHLLYPQFVCEDTERHIGLGFGLKLLELCDELWVFGDRISIGMSAEIEEAKKRGMPIKYIRKV